MSSIRAVTVDLSATAHLALTEVAAPTPAPSEAIVQVAAFSLNLGEVRIASFSPAGNRIGWDLAGTIVQAAADGSGPRVGARVVGMLRSGAWAEQVAVPTNALATLPENVSFTQAATLPVAGLTALWAVDHGTRLLGRTVLVTGASGGVGLFACQIAKLAGARVVGVARREENRALVEEFGADQVVVSEDGAAAQKFGPYRLIVEGVGGPVLANVLPALAPDGLCVAFAASAGGETTLQIGPFMRAGRAALYGFFVFEEKGETVADGLDRLARLVGEGQITPYVSHEAPWEEVGSVAQQLLDRRIQGKAVLHINS